MRPDDLGEVVRVGIAALAFASDEPDGTYGIDWITAGQDWAVEVALAAGLALSPDSPLFACGPAPRGAFRPHRALL